MNICGCLVHVNRNTIVATREEIEQIQGVEVHAQTEDGRLVVVVEDTEDTLASDTIMALHQIPGVITLTLNYHHFEDIPLRAPLAAFQPET
ncbi:chaperone NapD [Amaricoccus tamworthensis]|uniref:chaperone NapD n=1 Tax=Amaricoccus tamworthensis TaxID=57002 RepID=UPI003C7E93D5